MKSVKLTPEDEAALAATEGVITRADFIRERAREIAEKERRAEVRRSTYTLPEVRKRVDELIRLGVFPEAWRSYATNAAVQQGIIVFEKWASERAARRSGDDPISSRK
jgi:hypothetical protein